METQRGRGIFTFLVVCIPQNLIYIFLMMYTSVLKIINFKMATVVMQSKISKNPVFLIIYVKSCCNRYIYSCGLDIDKNGDI